MPVNPTDYFQLVPGNCSPPSRSVPHLSGRAAMEEYLENMKSLRSYMNDLEEDASKRSAEEQQQRTAIDAHNTEIALVRARVKGAREEVQQLAEARAQVCVGMKEKQGRIAILEVEGATLKQTLELLHQEIASTSAKLIDKRLFYTKTTEDMTVKLQEQQVWLGSLKNKTTIMEPHVSLFPHKDSYSVMNIVESSCCYSTKPDNEGLLPS